MGVWPFRYWTARNKQTSCSQPWPPPCGIQDVCVSSSLLCLNTVCGMTCEGGQLWQQELGNLGSVSCLLSPFFLAGSFSSSLLLQALGLTHPCIPFYPQEGPKAGSLQMLYSADCRLWCPNPGPILLSSGHLYHDAQPRLSGNPSGSPSTIQFSWIYEFLSADPQ